ncbi:hypothetical protein FPS14_contig00024-0046 [Flavobacterium psychrophilum]|nr:hypothetical protein FPS14_contig00024-0046 [Flavobacterium psychrophilum]
MTKFYFLILKIRKKLSKKQVNETIKMPITGLIKLPPIPNNPKILSTRG